jgi:hypothetical protein
MNYNEYFKKLTKKNEERKWEFPKEKVFSFGKGKYHTNLFTYKNCKYNFVISTQNSQSYGKEFIGFIVEIFLDKDNNEKVFNNLYKHKEDIEDYFGEETIIWQDKKDTPSGNVYRVYSKYCVEIEDEDKWDECIDWQINTMIKFLEIFPNYSEDI